MGFVCENCGYQEIACPNCNSQNIRIIDSKMILVCPYDVNITFTELALSNLSKKVFGGIDGWNITYENILRNLSESDLPVDMFIDTPNQTEGTLQRNLLKFAVCRGKASMKFDVRNHLFRKDKRSVCEYLEICETKKGKSYAKCRFNFKDEGRRVQVSKNDFRLKRDEILER